MHCHEFEQLLDAYLERNLHGSLRLEFDAHRIKCRDCQQKLVTMEAFENTLASDDDLPALSDGFADRVMLAVERQQPRTRRLLSTRVAVVGGMMLQAAAVLAFAILMHPAMDPANPPAPTDAPALVVNDARPDPAGLTAPSAPSAPSLTARLDQSHSDVEYFEDIVDSVESRMQKMHTAGQSFTQEVVQIAQYLNVEVPGAPGAPSESVAAAEGQSSDEDAAAPSLEAAPETPPAAPQVFSL